MLFLKYDTDKMKLISTKEEVKNLLKRFDIDVYEKMFGELEEA